MMGSDLNRKARDQDDHAAKFLSTADGADHVTGETVVRDGFIFVFVGLKPL